MKWERRPGDANRVSAAACMCAAALALTLSACTDQAAVGVGIAPSRVLIASPIPVSASISATGGIDAPAFEIGVFAARPVDLEFVTIHMVNGTNLGGPSITFPKANLTSQFGSRRIPSGVTRPFTFLPRFNCCYAVPQFVSADVGVIDLEGTHHVVTIRGPWAGAQ
jgi:hypothetical protein